MNNAEILQHIEHALTCPEVIDNKELFNILEYSRKLALNFINQNGETVRKTKGILSTAEIQN